jgi:hypothetical protein
MKDADRLEWHIRLRVDRTRSAGSLMHLPHGKTRFPHCRGGAMASAPSQPSPRSPSAGSRSALLTAPASATRFSFGSGRAPSRSQSSRGIKALRCRGRQGTTPEERAPARLLRRCDCAHRPRPRGACRSAGAAPTVGRDSHARRCRRTKPSPDLYLAAVEALGVQLRVGRRVRTLQERDQGGEGRRHALRSRPERPDRRHGPVTGRPPACLAC